MKYKKILMLAILLVTLLTVSTVSAADNTACDVVSMNDTAGETVSVGENPVILLENNVGSFKELASEITKAKGELNLSKNYKYSSGDSAYIDGITINKKIVINGNGHTIDGSKAAKIFNIKKSNVALSNLNIINGNSYDSQSVVYWSGDYGILSNCTFTNCGSQGPGAVCWCSDHGVLSNCTFMNCHSNNWGGGALTFDAFYSVLSDCDFINCRTNKGAGAVNWGGYENVMANCSFEKCHSNNGYGGAFYSNSDWSGDCILANCSFVECSANKEGGAIYWGCSRSVLANCSFEKCLSKESTGGAIYCDTYSTDTIYNCSFKDCSAYEEGGAIYDNYDTVFLTNCSFVNCSSFMGGAVYLIGICVLSNSNFISCHSREIGGAIICQSRDCSISRCSFVNCYSDLYGGAVCWWGANSSVSQSIFINCSANDYGGGIRFGGENCSLIDSVFKGNSAHNDSDWYSDYPLNVIENTTMRTVIRASKIYMDYGVPENLIVTLKGVYNNILIGEKISILLNDVKYNLTTDSFGQVSFEIPAKLVPNKYIATITYDGSDRYYPSSTTANITVNKAYTHFEKVYHKKNCEIVATLSNSWSEKGIVNAKVMVNINGTNTTMKTNSKGQVKVSTADLPYGNYKVTFTFKGNDKYMAQSTSIDITTKTSMIISADYDENIKEIVATLKNEATGKPVTNAKVQISINGTTTTVKSDSKGIARLSTMNLPCGNYTAYVSYEGNEKYKPSGTSIDIATKASIIISDIHADSNELATMLTNVNTGKAIEGADVQVNINGMSSTTKSDSKGRISVDTSDLNATRYDAAIYYPGNSKYNPSCITTTIDLNNANMIISASYNANTQELTVSLTNGATGKTISNANIQVTLGGIIAAAKSNSKGQIFISTGDFDSGTYLAIISYGGNSKYNPASTVAKIVV